MAFAATLLPLLSPSSLPTAAAATAAAVDLGTFGGTESRAYAVNASGQVVGWSYTNPDTSERHAFSWTSGGGMVDLGPGTAEAVNDSGQVVGVGDNGGFSWTPGGGMVSTGFGIPYAINASGQVVGHSGTAFSWTSAGGLVDLGTLGGASSGATAVSDTGQVVGGADTDTGEFHAFSWTSAGGMVDLGTLGGTLSRAEAVNASGQVAGEAYDANGDSHAVLWMPGGVMVDIGPGIVEAMNARGQVVGGTADGNAFSWTLGGGMVNLGGSLARAVNDNGQVVGNGFSWTPGGGFVGLSGTGYAVNASGLVAGYADYGSGETHATVWNVDTTAPTITITAPYGGASNSLGQAVTADYSCSDPSGVQSCLGPVPSGGSVDTSTAGGHSFQVTAVDNAGNSRVATVNYTVLAGNVSQAVTGGGMVTTDPGGVGTSTAVPVQTQIVAPPSVTGTIAVIPGPTSTISPAGYALFGQQLALSGPTGTAASPYVVTFTVDGSQLVDAAGNPISPADVQVFRNGLLVADCSAGTGAAPDPCVASRAAGPGGRAMLAVRTSAFSQWNIGRLRYLFAGFNQPVDNPPVVNTAKAGSAIPVKFSLGGNRGLNVFAAGSPTSVASACGTGASDAIEQTVTAGGSTLSFDAASGQYNYVWKTDSTWRGCRTLQVRFRDGNRKTALLNFPK